VRFDQSLTSSKQPSREFTIRMLLEACLSESSLLDAEDKDILTSFGLGRITLEGMTTFFRKKAQRIQEQLEKPQ